MADIEQGLKEAIAEAQAKGREEYGGIVPGDIVRSPQRRFGRTGNGNVNYTPVGIGEDKRPSLTAPQVIETILGLTKQAREIEALAYELSDALAGGADAQQGHPVPSNTPEMSEMSVFYRMGLGLLDLTRVLETIDREVKRSLGAVKP